MRRDADGMTLLYGILCYGEVNYVVSSTLGKGEIETTLNEVIEARKDILGVVRKLSQARFI